MIKAIPMEDWLRGCIYHDGRHGYVTLPCDEVLKIADFIERLRADRKTEPQPTTDCRQTDCYMCKWLGEVDVCGRCRNRNLFAEADTEPKPKDEPTTKTETQNSNLTFDKRCKGCDHYKLTCDLFSEVCKYEPTTEDCSTVPTSSKMEQVQPQTCSVNGRPYTECCNCEYFKCTADEPQTERIKTPDYCDICNHKGCGNCIANNLDDYCVPSGYEPTTQTETQTQI